MSIYLNNAGAGIMSSATLNTVIDHLRLETEVGAYKAAIERETQISEFYRLAAQIINAPEPDRVAFVDSASRGWNLVMYGIDSHEYDTIVTLSSEYGTNLLTLYDIAYRRQCNIEVIQCSPNGEFSMHDVEASLCKGRSVLAVSHAAAHGAIVNPVYALGELAEKYNALYVVDGCQAVGQIHVDVQQMKCTAYITAGRKWLCGPRGTGFIFVKKDAPIRSPQIDLASADLVFNGSGIVTGLTFRDDAKQFELWEKNIASLIGLKNAMQEYFDHGIENTSKDIQIRAELLKKGVLSNHKLKLVGNESAATGVVGFTLKDPAAEKAVRNRFAELSIGISFMCDWDCPLHFPRNGEKYIFRLSPHRYTPMTDINFVNDVLGQI